MCCLFITGFDFEIRLTESVQKKRALFLSFIFPLPELCSVFCFEMRKKCGSLKSVDGAVETVLVLYLCF